MGDIRVGDDLFGWPVVEITETPHKIIIMPAPGVPVSFDADQFTQTTLDILALAGSFVPHH